MGRKESGKANAQKRGRKDVTWIEGNTKREKTKKDDPKIGKSVGATRMEENWVTQREETRPLQRGK